MHSNREAATAALVRSSDRAPVRGTPWAWTLACCRALMADGDAAEARYQESFEQLSATTVAIVRARTHVLWGRVADPTPAPGGPPACCVSRVDPTAMAPLASEHARRAAGERGTNRADGRLLDRHIGQPSQPHRTRVARAGWAYPLMHWGALHSGYIECKGIAGQGGFARTLSR